MQVARCVHRKQNSDSHIWSFSPFIGSRFTRFSLGLDSVPLAPLRRSGERRAARSGKINNDISSSHSAEAGSAREPLRLQRLHRGFSKIALRPAHNASSLTILCPFRKPRSGGGHQREPCCAGAGRSRSKHGKNTILQQCSAESRGTKETKATEKATTLKTSSAPGWRIKTSFSAILVIPIFRSLCSFCSASPLAAPSLNYRLHCALLQPPRR